MPKFKNVSGDDRRFPMLRRVVEAGAVIDVSPEQGAYLVGQDETWQPVAEPKKTPEKNTSDDKAAG